MLSAHLGFLTFMESGTQSQGMGWVFPHQLKHDIDSPTVVPIGQTHLRNSPLKFFPQIILDRVDSRN